MHFVQLGLQVRDRFIGIVKNTSKGVELRVKFRLDRFGQSFHNFGNLLMQTNCRVYHWSVLGPTYIVSTDIPFSFSARDASQKRAALWR